MITTYRNKRTNQYIVKFTDEYDKMSLFPLLYCNREPCKVFLNRKHYMKNYTPITRKEYLENIYSRTINRKTYAPTVIDIYKNN